MMGLNAYASSWSTCLERPITPIGWFCSILWVQDLLDQYGRHLMATSYRPTGATTKELEKLYGYRLKAKATKQFSADGHDVFYRADCYRPASPRYTKEQFPYKEVLKDRR